MNAKVQEGRALAHRIWDAHAPRLAQMQDVDAVAFVAGVVMGILGGAAGIISADAVVPLLEQALEETRNAARSERGEASH
jgi:hypothetical protein